MLPVLHLPARWGFARARSLGRSPLRGLLPASGFGWFALGPLAALAGFAVFCLTALVVFALAAGVLFPLAFFAMCGFPAFLCFSSGLLLLALHGLAVFADFGELAIELLLHFLGLAVQFAGLFFQSCGTEVFGGLVEMFDSLAVFAHHAFDFSRLRLGGGKAAAGECRGDDDRGLHGCLGGNVENVAHISGAGKQDCGELELL